MTTRRRCLTVLFGILAAGAAGAACAKDPGRPTTDTAADLALATITADSFAADLNLLAHDSMRGRAALSAENEKAKVWVAHQFQVLGLTPGGDLPGYYQQFQVSVGGDLGYVSNVIAILPGSDSLLSQEAVVFTSHLDHIGTIADPLGCHADVAAPADSICNGADDNASGTAGIVRLAAAFASLQQHPKRTIVFAVMNGEEEGLIGSNWYVQHPRWPIAKTVAVINLDMIARHPAGIVNVAGTTLSSLGGVLATQAQEHYELGLTPAEYPGVWQYSDHYPFAAAGVPALMFCSGRYADLHTVSDNPDRAEIDQATRIVKLAFLTGYSVANTAQRPTLIP